MPDVFDKARGIVSAIVNSLRRTIIGKEDDVRLIIAALIGGGHVLIEGPPGAGKTLIAKAVAAAIGGTFKRVQGSPDLLPTDITGYHIYDLTGGSRFVKGPVFANILMFDELNRTHPRAQSALLQAMMEYQVSVDGITYDVPKPFHVIATEIPEGLEIGVYPLTMTLRDRFWIRISSGYSGPDDEYEIVKRSDTLYDLSIVRADGGVSLDDFIWLQDFLGSGVYVDDRIVQYIVDLLNHLRRDERVVSGPSHRGGIYLYRIGKAVALIEGRDYVIPDDIKYLAVPVLAHRIVLREDITGKDEAEALVKEVLESVPVPKE